MSCEHCEALMAELKALRTLARMLSAERAQSVLEYESAP